MSAIPLGTRPSSTAALINACASVRPSEAIFTMRWAKASGAIGRSGARRCRAPRTVTSIPETPRAYRGFRLRVGTTCPNGETSFHLGAHDPRVPRQKSIVRATATWVAAWQVRLTWRWESRGFSCESGAWGCLWRTRGPAAKMGPLLLGPLCACRVYQARKGMMKVNRVSSADDLTVSVPSCAFAISDAMCRPSPKPWRLARTCPRKNG